jgi:adenylate cyclase
MDASGTTLTFAALAERLLDRRLAQPDLRAEQRTAAERDAVLRRAFRDLAGVFALDRAFIAGQPVAETIPAVARALTEAVQASDCRLVLKAEGGGYFFLRADSAVGDDVRVGALGGLTGRVVEEGRAQAFGDVTREDGFAAAIDWLGGKPPASFACAPLRRMDGETIGAVQLFDKRSGGAGCGGFDDDDLALAATAGIFLAELAANAGLLPGQANGARLVPRDETAMPSGDGYGSGRELMLSKILATALEILAADRGWIFLHDPVMDELYTCLSEGLGNQELRVGVGNGIAGAVFRNGEPVSTADAYQDPRFNPSIDWQIGYRTRSILCVPVSSGDGRRLGVVQIVNKRHGAFDAADEKHLKALAAQMGVTLDYTALFEQILRMKSYNESMLRSLSNGVVTIDMGGQVTFVNAAALRILRRGEDEPGGGAAAMLGRPITKVFGEMNAWLLEALDEVAQHRFERHLPNSEFYIEDADEWIPTNLAILPLLDPRETLLGVMLVIEDLERERELRRTMSRYLSNEVIDRLLTESSGDVLGGAAATVTTLFSDIRGFTTMSEELGAAGTVTMLNEYFSYMEDVVANHSGIIDKYIGDAVMALFGSPFPTERDAQNAVQAACDMHRVLDLLNARRAAAGSAPIRIGVGVATGTVVAGNIGSPKRMDFTVIGDPVNLASRIEGLTKHYGADILVCDDTVRHLAGPLRMRRVDVVRVKGQQRPTGLFEILEHRDAAGAQFEDAVAAYEQGLDAYVAGDWPAAVARFEAALALREDDAAAAIMLRRCRDFLAHPPADWDGVMLLTSK